MAIPEPHGIPSISEQRTNHIIKSLNADLRAVSASLAAAEERVKALEAENEQLGMTVQLIAFSGGNLSLAEVCALALKTYQAMEALQAKEAE